MLFGVPLRTVAPTPNQLHLLLHESFPLS
uniref:Uncharacterized protein n=1 Tax=Arundo donax TaxID=35708 RepID=A0A0A9BGM5_ARUDO